MVRRILPFLLAACQEYNLTKDPPGGSGGVDSDGEGLGLCAFDIDPEPVDPFDACTGYDIGGFTPYVEFTIAPNKSSRAMPAVGDIDGDGIPEIVVNVTGFLPGAKGELWVVHGDGSGLLWKKTNADLGYAAAPAIGDIDGDGDPEILAVRANGGQLPTSTNAAYAVVAWDHEGNELWETQDYGRNNFDYGTGIVLSDMDHDGVVEIVAGRVIFRPDGTERGKGDKGRGSYGILPGGLSEATIAAVADLDLDGVEEIIVGDAWYDPDGNTIWEDPRRNATDGMIGIANLDDDPEGEWVASHFNRIRAHDTDGSLLWGPLEVPSANIVSPPAIADIDQDGRPEVVVAGGNHIIAYNGEDGSILWDNPVQDESGATGASIFDFDGDGVQEVVYIDEIRLYAFNGNDGATKFQSDEHASDTMMDYPVIADVDGDRQAEIVVAHANFNTAVTVYGQSDGRWAPTRPVWNQHAYAINQVDDDLSIPQDAVPGFTTHNTWHAATDAALYEDPARWDLTGEVVDICRAECDANRLYVAARPVNHTPDRAAPAGISVTLSVVRAGGVRIPIETQVTSTPIEPGMTGEAMIFQVPVDLVDQAAGFEVAIDDDGSRRNVRVGTVPECFEDDNVVFRTGPFCEE